MKSDPQRALNDGQGQTSAAPSPYTCPTCSELVAIDGSEIHCTKCEWKSRVLDGVPVLDAPDNIWLQRRLPSTLNDAIRAEGFEQAIQKHVKEHVANWIRNPRRSNPLYAANIGPGTRLLDAGCGWGSLSMGVADIVSEVHPIDVGAERLEFISLWAKHMGYTNVHPARASVLRRPFQDEYFDTIVMSGVLEWTAVFAESGDPETIQREVLRNMNRMLAPGGQMLLMIENRMGLTYWLGEPDEHTGFRYITVLPRKLAGVMHKARTGKPYRALTHTRKWLTDSLLGAGFSKVQTYGTLPHYRTPWRVIDLDSQAAWEHFCHTYDIGGASWRRRLGGAAWDLLRNKPELLRPLVREVVPAYMMVATK